MKVLLLDTFQSDAQDEIDTLYNKLHKFAKNGDKKEFDQCLSKLRILQNKEAQEMRETFQRNFPVNLEVVHASLEKADALLRKYETPSSTNSSMADED